MGEWRAAAGFVANLDFVLSVAGLVNGFDTKHRDQLSPAEVAELESKMDAIANGIHALPVWQKVMVIIGLLVFVILLSGLLVLAVVLIFLLIVAQYKLMEATREGTQLSQADIVEKCRTYIYLHGIGIMLLGLTWLLSPARGKDWIGIILPMTFIYVVNKYMAELVSSNSVSSL